MYFNDRRMTSELVTYSTSETPANLKSGLLDIGQMASSLEIYYQKPFAKKHSAHPMPQETVEDSDSHLEIDIEPRKSPVESP
eukprot:CAMPEP_0170487456 /NCGR_PEP_ID=MMETSP0208-20121228/6265_1 /TAXON_ID=197538 /ORGANISM="Strombidium inclinatum, Strain S3" /LENGTH=81 /DNA_ID=CAMNT_0010761739 /DNA_START=90 /DNA_END=335 /DNA_ORIENTATION=+